MVKPISRPAELFFLIYFSNSAGNRFTGTVGGTTTAVDAKFIGTIDGNVSGGEKKSSSEAGSNALSGNLWKDPSAEEAKVMVRSAPPISTDTLSQAVQATQNNNSSTGGGVNISGDIHVHVPQTKVSDVSSGEELAEIVADEFVDILKKEVIRNGEG